MKKAKLLFSPHLFIMWNLCFPSQIQTGSGKGKMPTAVLAVIWMEAIEGCGGRHLRET